MCRSPPRPPRRCGRPRCWCTVSTRRARPLRARSPRSRATVSPSLSSSAPSGSRTWTSEPHVEDVTCLGYCSPNLLASGAFDGTICMWNLASGTPRGGKLVHEPIKEEGEGGLRGADDFGRLRIEARRRFVLLRLDADDFCRFRIQPRRRFVLLRLDRRLRRGRWLLGRRLLRTALLRATVLRARRRARRARPPGAREPSPPESLRDFETFAFESSFGVQKKRERFVQRAWDVRHRLARPGAADARRGGGGGVARSVPARRARARRAETPERGRRGPRPSRRDTRRGDGRRFVRFVVRD